ncbi:MAG: DUF6178 family protein [Caldimicrobium sp.]|nr:DUF6178 family protein [Caldimicrobium sp.]MCX7612823.1 DUF6178 family protein [Caldimicrobium sp.]MDW8183305.1 DUF6178 family protein [Caldimicrobium sp.]
MNQPFSSKETSLSIDLDKLFSLSEAELESALKPLKFEELMEILLRAPWESKARLILLSPYPTGLVRNLPLIEFFLTLKASSLEQAVELLSHAKGSQIQFLFDFDAWFKDRLKAERILSWLILIYEAGEDLLKRWLEVADWDFLIAMMQKFLRIHKRSDEVDILEARDFLPPFTLDDFYFVEFKDEAVEFYFRRIIEIIRDEWPEMYFSLMEALIAELPSEVEERAFRFRNGRLADEGIPDYFTSLEVYSYIHPRGLSTVVREYLPGDVSEGGQILYLLPYEGEGKLPIFNILGMIGDTDVLVRIQRELAWLATKVTLVDHPVIDGIEEVKGGIFKMWAGLNLGIEYLAGSDLEKAKSILENHYLEEIFRVSRTALRELRRFALSIVTGKDFNPVVLKYLDQPYEGYLKGVLAKNLNEVKLFNPAMIGTSEEYVEFSRVGELRMVRRYLEEIAYIAPLLERSLGSPSHWIKEVLKPSRNFDHMVLTWSSLILTAISSYLLNGEFIFRAVPRSRWQELLQSLIDIKDGNGYLKDSIKEILTENFKKLARSHYYVDEDLLTGFMNFVFNRFEGEFRYVDLENPPDPLYQNLILVEL